MPYYVHPIDLEIPDPIWLSSYQNAFDNFVSSDGVQEFDSPGVAHQETKGDRSLSVSYVPDYETVHTWRVREETRFEDGTYIPIPWKEYESANLRRLHYCHISTEKDGMVAYTKTVEHGVNDRQTRTRPGRYLQEFYDGVFSPERIADFVAQCQAIASGKLQIATSRADVCRVYMGGPPSCMDGSHVKHGDIQSTIHPSAIYAQDEGSDLAVAYHGDLDHASQRCVIWPDEKKYIRIYGDGPLSHLLARAGYTKGDIYNARVPAIRDRDGLFLMPYVDGCSNGTLVEHGKRICLDDDGPIQTQHVNGLSGEVEPDDPEVRCTDCREYFPEDDINGDGRCNSCSERRWICEHCDTTFSDDEESTSVNGESWCHSCYESEAATCADENCNNTWIEDDEFTRVDMDARKRHDLTDLCRSCASKYTYCELCEKSYDRTEESVCPTCGRAPRCSRTLSLPLVSLPYVDAGDTTSFPSNGDTMYTAISRAFWALSSGAGTCRVTACQAPIPIHTVFLSPYGGHGYCQTCATRLLRDYPIHECSSLEDVNVTL